MNYLISISYDGKKYKGWQKLNSTPNTIQGKLEEVLAKYLADIVELNGSGRTDAGVHAINQYASFESIHDIDKKVFLSEINEFLPQDIRITSLRKMEKKFHARLHAKTKTYLYKIDNSAYGNPLMKDYSYHVPETLDIQHMRNLATALIGEHDFTTFTNAKSNKKSNVREIYSIEIRKKDQIEIEITGNGFLYNMVRKIVATLVENTIKNKSLKDVNTILNSKDRSLVTYLAPSKGLYLKEVSYK